MEKGLGAQKAAHFLTSLVSLSLNQVGPAKYLPCLSR